MPLFGVMRFDKSISTLVSCEASGAGGCRLTCGNEISSATKRVVRQDRRREKPFAGQTVSKSV
jgi:hypothetical protein